MAYGFGTTLGTGTTDKVTTALTSSATTRSYGAWIYARTLAVGVNARIIGKDLEVAFYMQTGGGGEIHFAHFWSGTDLDERTVGGVSAATWTHYLVTYDSSLTTNHPVIYKNGAVQSITVTTGPPTGTADTNSNAHVIGNDSASSRIWDGMLADVAIWDRILTAGEAAILGARYSALFIPNGLVEYVPLVRDLVSYKNAAPTVAGTPLVQPHPRIIYPAPSVYTTRPSPAPAGRTTKNTRSSPLGIEIGMGWRMDL